MVLRMGSGEGTNTIGRLDGVDRAGFAFAVEHADAVRGFSDFGDRRVIADELAQGVGEGVGDAVHTADGLEHGGLHVEELFKKDGTVELRFEQVGKWKRRERNFDLIGGAG